MYNIEELDHLGMYELAPYIGQRCVLYRDGKKFIGRLTGIDNSQLPVYFQMDNPSTFGAMFSNGYRAACSEVKIILRDIGSMTLEEQAACVKFINANSGYAAFTDPTYRHGSIRAKWALSNGFDVYGYIGQGLALKLETAIEDNYHNKKK